MMPGETIDDCTVDQKSVAPCNGSRHHARMAARGDQAIIFRVGEPYYTAIRKGIERSGLSQGQVIPQILLAAFGESELLEQLRGAEEHGREEGFSAPAKRSAGVHPSAHNMKPRSRKPAR